MSLTMSFVWASVVLPRRHLFAIGRELWDERISRREAKSTGTIGVNAEAAAGAVWRLIGVTGRGLLMKQQKFANPS